MKPETGSWTFNTTPLLTSFAFTSAASASLGWWARGNLGSGYTSESQPLSEPEIEARVITIDTPRLPSSEKARVMKDREAAREFLVQRYPLDEYTIYLDIHLPCNYYDDPDTPLIDQVNDVDEILTSPAVLYRVVKKTDKGKTVAMLLWAHPDAQDCVPMLLLRVKMLQQSIVNKEGFVFYGGERI